MRFFLLLLTLTSVVHALSPNPAYAEGCGSQATFCACTYSDGDEVFQEDANITTSSLCEEACTASGSESWHFYCNDTITPTAEGSIEKNPNSSSTNTSTSSTPASGLTSSVTNKSIIVPTLNTPIPGLDLEKLSSSVQKSKDGMIYTNMIGVYVNAVYRYALVIAAILGVLMLSISGFQYMTAGGNKGAVAKAKGRMEQTVFGLVILMAIYAIAFFIDPRLTRFLPLEIQSVEEIELNMGTMGAEGGTTSGTYSSQSGTSSSGGSGNDATYTYQPGTWKTQLSSANISAIEAAKKAMACPFESGFTSPTGGLPSPTNYHWFTNGIIDYKKISTLDWPGSFGNPIYAPVDGTVNYKIKDRVDDCGNTITLAVDGASGYNLSFCHVRDFTNQDGDVVTGKVKRGDIIGHIGGVCCALRNSSGELISSGHSYTECTASGTACDPEVGGNCTCQSYLHVGNVTGPHVHMQSSQLKGGKFLACFE